MTHDIPFPGPDPENPAFTFIDLFAGIGGFRIALQEIGGLCVFSSEIDPSARATYLANYGDTPHGDITEIPAADIPRHDLLAAGFPCQPFSQAGKGLGFDDPRGTMFGEILRITDHNIPTVLLLENVKNITTHDGGRTFATIRQSLEDRGYLFHYAVYDSQHLVPQRRKRAYMVAIDALAPRAHEFTMPVIDGPPHPLSEILEPYSPEHEKYRLSDRAWEGHVKRTLKHELKGYGFGVTCADPSQPSGTIVARYGKDGKECLIRDLPDANPRMLTPDECRRLQGYPDNFVLPSSKTAAYRQFGNSVTVPIVRRIAEHLRLVL